MRTAHLRPGNRPFAPRPQCQRVPAHDRVGGGRAERRRPPGRRRRQGLDGPNPDPLFGDPGAPPVSWRFSRNKAERRERAPHQRTMTVGGVTCTSHWSIDQLHRQRVGPVLGRRRDLHARDDLLGAQGAHDLGRARQAHVDLGGLRLRVRVPEDGDGHLREGPLDDLAADLDRRAARSARRRSTRPGGRSIASCARVLALGEARRRRRRRRARAA